ncbi:hypothetical protein C7S15_3578 [Burkholderia cepacia]|nr:hypothetical protein [Burkholderia cepacia]
MGREIKTSIPKVCFMGLLLLAVGVASGVGSSVIWLAALARLFCAKGMY